MAELFLQNIGQKNENGDTALIIAAKNKSIDVARLLLNEAK